MSRRDDSQARLFIRNPDSHGNEVDLELIKAAHRLWESARLIVIRYLIEDTEAADILEAVVDAASCSRNDRPSIQHLDAYILRSVARESIRRRRKRRIVTYVDPTDLDRLAGAITYDWDRQLDDEKWIDLLRASLDPKGREMLGHRILEYDWSFIAGVMGYATAHSAEVQFRKKIDKALERIHAHHSLKRKRLQDWKSNE